MENREIKFRVLVSDQFICRSSNFKYTYHWEYIFFEVLFARAIGELFVNHNIKKDSLGQFTGLKDKKGKEIYGGDILSNGTIKWKVIWVKRGEGLEDGYVWGHAPDYAGFNVPFDLEDFEVIGNIFENPELLNNQK